MDLSLSSKHLLFLSSKDITLSNGEQLTIYDHFYDDQICLASTTDCGITQLTPNKPKTIDHKSIATRQ